MSTKKRKMVKCPYTTCVLPKNNNSYGWQLAFLTFGVLAFGLKGNDFSFLNIFLFLFPVLLDLIGTDFPGKVLKGIKCIYIVINSISVFVCFLGIAGIVQENGLIINIDSLYWGVIDVSYVKKVLLCITLANIVVPIILWIGRPCIKNAERYGLIREGKDDSTSANQEG